MASEISFTKAKWAQDSEGCWLQILVDNSSQAKQFCFDKKDKPYIAILKEENNKRSRNANSYFWNLCDKLAEKIHIPKIDIYQNLIKNIGGNSYISPVLLSEKEKAIKFWEHQGLGWLCEDTGSSKIDGCTNIIFYAGSSVYDTEQMSRLIDLIVQECKTQDIETATPEEIARLKAEWSNE